MLLVVVWSIMMLCIYLVKVFTYEKGTDYKVTKRKYNRIMTIMRCKIWLLRHFPKTVAFLGLSVQFKHAQDTFGHHYGL